MSVIARALTPPQAFEAEPPQLMSNDLLTMEDDGLFELVDGKLVKKKMSYLANRTAGKLTGRLDRYLTENPVGDVLPEQSFCCFPGKPRQVRRPDIAVITAARIPPVLPAGHVEVAPDIAIEILSPTNTAYEMDEKLDDYWSAGVPLVWVVNPEARLVRIHQAGQPIVELRDDDVLRGDPVLPGFAVPVRELWPPVAVAPVADAGR